MKYVDVQGVSFVTVLSTAGVMGCQECRLSWGRAAILCSAVEDTLSTAWIHKFPHKCRHHLKIAGAGMMT